MPQRVLITGANRGLGLAFVRHCLRRGDLVLATCRHPERATELQALLEEFPARLQLATLDVTDADAIDRFVSNLPTEFDALDLLVNNAGVLPSGERFGQVSATSLETAFRTNALGPFLLSQASASRLARGHRAIVLNISTVLASIAAVGEFRSASYAISKAALNMVGALLGQALADQGVRVVNLHPGWLRTSMGGEHAPLAPEAAVTKMMATLERLPADCRGGFFDADGAPLPW